MFNMYSFTRSFESWNVNGYTLPRGWGNGYVVIPYLHRLHGRSYDDLNDGISIHGGLTFAQQIDSIRMLKEWGLPAKCLYGWCVGFDTAHWSDSPITWPKERVEEETQSLLTQLKQL